MTLPDGNAGSVSAQRVLPSIAPAPVVSIRLSVTDSQGTLLESTLFPVTPGQPFVLSLEVPSGPGRIFIAEGFDAGGNVLFHGESQSVDLVEGVPADISIAMNSSSAPPPSDSPPSTGTDGIPSERTSGVNASPTGASADGRDTVTITVTVRDANRRPVPGAAVVLSSSRGDLDIITQPSGATNASGRIEGTVRSNVAGSSRISAVVNGTVNLRDTVLVRFRGGGGSSDPDNNDDDDD
jgi:hypothetical protein